MQQIILNKTLAIYIPDLYINFFLSSFFNTKNHNCIPVFFFKFHKCISLATKNSSYMLQKLTINLYYILLSIQSNSD